jgi:hypothetical protein
VTFAILNGAPAHRFSRWELCPAKTNFGVERRVAAPEPQSISIREQRCYFRHPVEIPATVAFGEGES